MHFDDSKLVSKIRIRPNFVFTIQEEKKNHSLWLASSFIMLEKIWKKFWVSLFFFQVSIKGNNSCWFFVSIIPWYRRIGKKSSFLGCVSIFLSMSLKLKYKANEIIRRPFCKLTSWKDREREKKKHTVTRVFFLFHFLHQETRSKFFFFKSPGTRLVHSFVKKAKGVEFL